MLAAHEPQDTPAVGADSQEPSTRTFVSDMCRRGLLDVAASINVEEVLHVNRFTVLAVAASIWGLSGGFTFAAEHEVRMLNKGPEGQPMQFDPAFIKIEPGDSVKFIATDKGHNSESILEMIPETAEVWKGKINEEIVVTFDVEGIYGYKCMPHFGLGMVGIIQVGDSTENLDSAETAKLPGRAKSRMAELIAQVSSDGAEVDGAGAAD